MLASLNSEHPLLPTPEPGNSHGAGDNAQKWDFLESWAEPASWADASFASSQKQGIFRTLN